MGITLKTFIQWEHFNPGPGFVLPVRNGAPVLENGWQQRIPADSKTRLVAAIPSILSKPDVSEWKTDITSVEWKTVSDTWINVAQKILFTDPDFTYFRQSWFATADGLWTKQFRDHTLYVKFTDLLASKMDRLFAYNRGFIQGVEQVGASPTTPSPPGGGPPPGGPAVLDEPGADLSTQGFGSWIVRSVVWAARNPVARVFIPGPGQLIAPTIAIGIYAYDRWRRHGIDVLAGIAEPTDLDFTMTALSQIEVPVFKTDKDLGLLAVEHPTDPLYEFSKGFGAPNFLAAVGSNQYG